MMKRILSWLALVGCYIVFCLVIGLDMRLLAYIMGLYMQLSAFAKIITIVVGGSTILGIAIAPLFYGIPLTYSVCEAICPSRRGLRYLVVGIYIILSCVLEALTGFLLRDIFIGIYGISLVVYAWNHK